MIFEEVTQDVLQHTTKSRTSRAACALTGRSIESFTRRQLHQLWNCRMVITYHGCQFSRSSGYSSPQSKRSISTPSSLMPYASTSSQRHSRTWRAIATAGSLVGVT